MKLSKLHLENYRNYQAVDLAFSPSLNIFLGENAQGKTNLLESIYVLALTRSHRTNQEKEFIRFGSEFARLVAKIEKNNTSLTLEMSISSKGKKTKVNHLEQRKLSDYIGELNVVLFAPEDLLLIKGAPQLRRRFIDMELGQINPLYLYHLTVYQKVLKQRNKYLKELDSQPNEAALTFLDVLSDQLIDAGSQVMFMRMSFIKKLEKWAQTTHEKISNHKECLTLNYATSFEIEEAATVETIRQRFKESLDKNRKRELFNRSTSVGPHRDDLLFFINDKEVQTFGSQGQQRTTALSIKLAELELIHEELNEYPILLLDDVMSELDDERQIHLLETIDGKVQTFISTTTLKHLSNKLTTNPEIFKVASGTVTRSELI
ncbi:DNA replication/repair protein RecF [Vagococcus xieshaowenii]|uniref:DNA replication and repair protein RecF n=1 Tax=Vagococcus xieshaowenii TaxID=2562451 RepID=A0AAJ5EF05_9ENTE|nr:DNA replication/repair protein RecF [Vagococcus xieshaowenii]QCA27841.1 DNA replication/repair protein RecF [Vagococcus xieshaowenii]TFZ42446.1 DNA replication/repair protein RecF [Vagococcus xieshaowenii]